MESDKTRIVWITLLALADKNGEVQGSIPGLARLAGVSVEDCQAAIEKLLSPDKFSRTQVADGRRIEKIDGGWELINHAKYRALASKEDAIQGAAERKRRSRARLSQSVTVGHALSHGVTQNMDIADADADADADAEKNTPIVPTGDFEMVYQCYPKKVGKKAAIKAIQKALKDVPVSRLMDRVTAYAKAVSVWPDDARQYIPDPATWFNRGSYDDDPVTWIRQNNEQPSQRPYFVAQ